MKKEFYQKESLEIIKELNSNLESGLTSKEAEIRLEKNGLNKLDDVKRSSIFKKFIEQLKDFMIIILIAAAIISIVVAKEWAEGILIIAIVIVNAVLGVVQEAKAEKSIDSIKELSSPHIIVIRDGKEKQIDVKELVIGDIVLLEAGDFIPADLRIIKSINLKVDESALTGEAVPVDKIDATLDFENVALGDQTNLAFMGTVITYGRGVGVVVKTGMDTEIGKIAEMLATTESDATPLQKSVNQLGKILAIIALSITALIFILEIVQGLVTKTNIDFLDAFLFAVALAVAAIPEGLPAIITVVLSLGMTNLVKQKAIMRTLPSVETLGSTNIICSDKTGTLTQNVMTVQKIYSSNNFYDTNNDLKINDNIEKLIIAGSLANDVKVRKENNNLIKFGDPTEIALIDLAIKYNYDPIDLGEKFERIHELPFDSKRKLMTSINKIDNNYYAIVKGAPDVLFNRSNKLLVNDDEVSLDKDRLNTIQSANNKMADEALRVLAVGYKKIDNIENIDKLEYEDIESDLTLIGLIGMIDPERPEVKDAISVCDTAGITTIMITGDHKNTAVAIAKNIGILKDENDLAITGLELDQMSDEEFIEKLPHIKVYARVSPENKVRIVKAWRSLDKVVAMTGDGVNDAPSIKQADIGIAMGITGTEVAKGAADMILTDDNFATIVNAVGEGRGIFANIKKSIHFLLSCNVGEIISMFLGVSVGMFLFKEASGEAIGTLHILTAVQILWVNLVTDSLMAIALGLEHREPDIMEMGPRDSKKSIFADGLGKKIAWQGLMIGLLTFLAFTIGWFWTGNNDTETKFLIARTMAFMVLSLSQLVHAFNARSETHSTFKLKRNKKLIYAFFISLTLQLIVIATPFTRNLFDVTTPNFLQWLVIIGLSILPLIIVETQKFITNKIKNK